MSAVSQGESRTVRRKAAPIAVVTALKEEFEAVLSRAREARFRGTFVEARIGTADVALCLTGDGAGQAARAADLLCETVRPTALLGAGIAGALSPDLAIGDVLVSRRIRDSQGDAPVPDARLLAQALENTGARAGTFLTVARPVVLASLKKALLQTLDDAAGPAAADMESSAWARAAASRGIPYLVARAISDRAEEDLPEYLGRCVGPDGGIRRSSVVLRALAQPATIPALLRMRVRVLACAEKLAIFLEDFLSGGRPS
jgi:adenosylhomocysteine nucleosidase